jgi:hypothetical protein
MNIHFAEWIAASALEEVPEAKGVYSIAKGGPSRVIYMGRTWGSDGLRGRLRAFLRSARTGLKSHAGGVTYHERFGPSVEDLHFAVHVSSVIMDDIPEIRYAYLQYVERRLIWEHVERWGHLPECNTE